jgi:hypothetical protein
VAWTAPRTWVTGETVTAALLNTHLRDNLLETGPAKVTTAGDLIYGSAANALARLAASTNGRILHLASGLPAWTDAPTLAGILTANGGIRGSSGNARLTEILRGTTTTDLGTLGAGNTVVISCTVTGAAVSVACIDVAFSAISGSDELTITGKITGADTVSIRIFNGDASSIDIPNGTYTAYVMAIASS